MAKAKLSPGLAFLIRNVGVIASPALVVLGLGRILGAQGVQVSAILIALTAVLSVPAVYALRVWYRRWSVRRRAAAMGAVLPPSWEGKRIGNIDILQHSMDMFNGKGYPGQGFWDKIEELGHLHSSELLWDMLYLTADANVIKTMLATDFAHWEKGDGFRDTMESVLGSGVFNADGDLWKWHRTMTRPYFSRDRISHFEMFDRHADIAIRIMKERFAAGHALDFQDLVGRFTLDSATEFLFGQCVHSLKTSLPYAYNVPVAQKTSHAPGLAERFTNAFVESEVVLAKRLRMGPVWPLAEMHRDESEPHMNTVIEYLQPILEEAIRKNKNAIGTTKKADDDEEAETLLDHLVKLTDDPNVLRDETLNILIAGRDTTASTLTFVVYLLCMYPDVFKRLRAEVMEKVPSNQMPTFDDIRGMKYLRAVVNETLRLYPIVPFNVRVPNQDVTIPNPDPTKPRVFVPAGCGIAYSVFLMHRRKDYWGPDALYFDPDRFLDDRLNKYFTANPFIFLPFNAGPRICLGQQFAYNEMSFFLIRLLQNFSHMELDLAAQPPHARPPAEWAGAEGQKGLEKIVPKAHLTLYVHGGLWVKMTEAERDC